MEALLNSNATNKELVAGMKTQTECLSHVTNTNQALVQTNGAMQAAIQRTGGRQTEMLDLVFTHAISKAFGQNATAVGQPQLAANGSHELEGHPPSWTTSQSSAAHLPQPTDGNTANSFTTASATGGQFNLHSIAAAAAGTYPPQSHQPFAPAGPALYPPQSMPPQQGMQPGMPPPQAPPPGPLQR